MKLRTIHINMLLTSVSTILLVILFGVSAFPQEKQITREGYWIPYRAAIEKARTLSRRHSQKIEDFRNEKTVTTEEWLYEYVLPDRIRYVHFEARNGQVRRTEQINIGKMMYCKRDGENWTITDGYCIGGSGRGGSQPLTERYAVEDASLDGRPFKRFLEYFTHLRPWLKGDEQDAVFFVESTYWLSSDGLIVRQEIRTGRTEPFTVERKTVETYEYEPKDLKIEAPIR